MPNDLYSSLGNAAAMYGGYVKNALTDHVQGIADDWQNWYADQQAQQRAIQALPEDQRLQAAIQSAIPLALGFGPGAMRNTFDISKIPVKAPTDNVYEVMEALSPYTREIGPKWRPIRTLKGGVNLKDPREASRVERLADQISSENGYISRLIADSENNVIEGQHRLEALRRLGAAKAPIYQIQDMASGFDLGGIDKVLSMIHPDQRTQLLRNLLEIFHDEGSFSKVRSLYAPPRGFVEPWNKALDYFDRNIKE